MWEGLVGSLGLIGFPPLHVKKFRPFKPDEPVQEIITSEHGILSSYKSGKSPEPFVGTVKAKSSPLPFPKCLDQIGY